MALKTSTGAVNGAFHEAMERQPGMTVLGDDVDMHGDVRAAIVTEEHIAQLDSPILRVAAADTHIPYAPSLERAAIANVDDVEIAL